ncbi:MAG: hypothetical protein IIA33_03950, partial [Planctomycetes bacterium]|nr:hypothetical protein [Planctomycetota bacterium]
KYKIEDIRPADAAKASEGPVGARNKLLSKFKSDCRALKHELRITLPAGYEPPAIMPNRLEASILVTAVEWDPEAELPTFTIYGKLIRSVDLKLDATGEIEATPNGQGGPN